MEEQGEGSILAVPIGYLPSNPLCTARDSPRISGILTQSSGPEADPPIWHL